MDEKILMLLTLEEISKINKGLNTALQYMKSENGSDENLKYEIYDMLQKLEYVQYEYSKKTE